MGGSDATNPIIGNDQVIDIHRLARGRSGRYLLLAIFGSMIGALILTVITSAIAAVLLGPLALATITSGLFMSIVVVPFYAVATAWLGKRWAKRHAISDLGIELQHDTPLTRRVERLATKAGLPRPPQVGVYESPDINALAVGSSRRNSLVAFTSAMIEKAADDEIDAVAAHEIGHIANGDMVALTTVNAVQVAMSWYMLVRGLKSFVRRFIFFVTELGAAALSRQREYRADAVAAALVGKEAVIGALRLLAEDEVRPPRSQRAYAMHRFADDSLRTHPPITDRIAAVETGRFAYTVPLRTATGAAEDHFLG